MSRRPNYQGYDHAKTFSELDNAPGKFQEKSSKFLSKRSPTQEVPDISVASKTYVFYGMLASGACGEQKGARRRGKGPLAAVCCPVADAVKCRGRVHKIVRVALGFAVDLEAEERCVVVARIDATGECVARVWRRGWRARRTRWRGRWRRRHWRALHSCVADFER